MNVLYEDNHLIVVEKKENIPSQKDDSNDLDMHTLVKQYIKEKYNKPGNVYLGLVHRLDRRVGGVMVFAKTSKAAARLSEQIRNRTVTKEYSAIVEGLIQEDNRWVDYLKKSNQRAVGTDLWDPEANEAILAFQVDGRVEIEKYNYSKVRIQLETGRYNQIRFQFSNRGHPIVNDYKYGYTGPNWNDQLGLWCTRMKIEHPVTKESMVFESNPCDGIWKYDIKKEGLL